ncbi:MAG TPA: ATP-dependent Clp protease ATP-binding subunit [Patescibacteria group bacterium]|nr:ATP-dependent Clp protease ATP-binding subunit [Patescibacteria group bacterium]
MMNFQNLIDRLSSRAKNALISAQVLSEKMVHPYIGTEHLLFGITSEQSSFAAEVLAKNKLTPENILQQVELVTAGIKADSWKPVISDNLKSVIERAAVIASHYGYQFIGTEHFLYGIVTHEGNKAKAILQNLAVNPKNLEQNLLQIFENISSFPEGQNELPPIPGNQHSGPHPSGLGHLPTKPGEQNGKQQSILEFFTSDLTQKAKDGKIDPVIGRNEEIRRMSAILCRRTKNNPVLIGEPGVGKTAIVEGLALKICEKTVPDQLLDKKILSLDLALVVAGSMFRGEFENRLKQIIDEVKSNPDIILFIDELHTMVGAGSAQGSLDAANILKPALARGELRAIGATTLAEYKKHIEHDAALERRFQPILVEQPSEAETIEILKGIRQPYEKHHGVTITDEAISSAVELSSRYIQDRFLPDKAIDLIDESAARLITSLEGNKALRDKKALENELILLETEKNKSVLNQDFTTAIHLKSQEEKLLKKKEQLEKELVNQTEISKLLITSMHIAETVSLMTKIPLQRLDTSESSRLMQLEGNLKAKVVGQDEAITEIAKAVRRSRAGIADAGRPIGSFIFLGPTGVGKTETAKQLAKEIFGDEDALIRVDMSEFMERHNVSRLIGAPAGYVGYEEGGKLTEAVRRKPYSVILFDELEKAHFEVFNILLQILEDGVITDAQGRTINFRNTVIIMTSNFGMKEFLSMPGTLGFTDDTAKTQDADYERLKTSLMTKMKEYFLPEFLGRVDRIVVFKPLGEKILKKIVTLKLSELEERLLKQNLLLKTSAAAVKFLAELNYKSENGARYIRKNIQETAEDQIAELIVSGKAPENSIIHLDVKDGQLVTRVETKRKATVAAR